MTHKILFDVQNAPATPTDAALAQLAATAAFQVNRELRLQPPLELHPVAQRDSALLWSAAVVHPLDRLETAWQGLVLGAARGVQDPDTALQIENDALSRFCFLDVQPLRLLGSPAGAEYANEPLPLMSDRLREAKAQIKAAEATLGPAGPRSQATLAQAARHLDAASRALGGALNAYKSFDGGRPRDVVPLLQRAYVALVGARQLPAPEQPGELRKALAALTQVTETGSAVQVFHNIGPFYLLRLLVRFRALSHKALAPTQRAECSSALTKLLTNGNPWVTEFLRIKLLELDAALKAIDPEGNVLFFLKGGRALAYKLGQPEAGENDWDTQVVINPLLAAADWYDLYLRVYNLLLMKLGEFKREFMVVLAQNAPALAQRMQQLLRAAQAGAAQAQPAPDAQEGLGEPGLPPSGAVDYVDEDEDEAPPTLLKRTGCKAELIDIGIPRRESIEAIEQWALLAGRLAHGADGMPIPGAAYYVNEYLMLVRAGVSGAARAPGKTVKRAIRLYLVLDADPQSLPPALANLLPRCAQALAGMGHSVAASAHAALLTQFGKAYDLEQETGLAACFDKLYADNCDTPGNVIPDLADTLAAFQGARGWDGAHDDMVAALAYAGYISDCMQQHWRDRAVYMAGRRASWLAFVQALTGAGIFSDGAEIRMALSGSLAASLHAGALNAASEPDLPPFDRVELSIVCRSADVDPPTIWALLAPVLQQAQFDSGLAAVSFQAPAGPGAPMLVPSLGATQIGAFTYAPVEGRITLEPASVGFPSLATVDDVALLALPDLIRQYRRWAGHTEEVGTVSLYRRALAALATLLTRFDDPEPMGYTVTQMRKGRVHHLQLSSTAYANGAAAEYPPAFHPDRAYTIALTDNPQAALRQLTMPPDATLDRSIDVLVINQGHGGPGMFERAWTPLTLTANVVEPLRNAGVTVHHLVLDFCESASLIPTFIPLCAPGGHIYAAMYDVSTVLLDSDTWRAMRPALERRQVALLGQHLVARMSRVSAIATGESQMQQFTAVLSEAGIQQWLGQNPADRDAISIVRYLPQLKSALYEPPSAQQGVADLLQLAGNVNLGDFERAILRPLGGGGNVTAAQLAQVKDAFAQRLRCILTQPRYQIGLPPDDIARLQPWLPRGAASLWESVTQYRGLLLSQARGIARCPSIFAVYENGPAVREVSLDSALLAMPGDQPTPAPLCYLFDDAAEAVADTRRFLVGVPLNGRNDFLQP